jgi:hypothetical protein
MLKTPADPVDVGLLSAQGSRFTCHYPVPELSRLSAGLAGQADRGVECHDPAVDLGGNLVAELDGEGGVAAGEVSNAHIC